MARKLFPPNLSTEEARALGVMPDKPASEDLSEEYVAWHSAGMELVEGGPVRHLTPTEREQALVDAKRKRRQPKGLSERADADRQQTLRLAGGVPVAEYRQTDHDRGRASDALKLRAMRDARGHGPLTPQERLAFRKIDLDPPREIAREVDPEVADIRDRVAERAERLGIDLDAIAAEVLEDRRRARMVG